MSVATAVKKLHDGSKWGNPPELVYDMSRMGFWLFLATELLLFAVLFTAYAVYYFHDPAGFHASAQELSVGFGAANTIILLVSSFTVAWSIEAIKQGNIRLMNILLAFTIGCGLVFLGNKYFEYSHKMHEVELEAVALAKSPALLKDLKEQGKCFTNTAGQEVCRVIPFNVANIGSGDPLTKPAFASMFFFLYFFLTGVHGLHIVVGVALLSWVLIKGLRGEFHPGWYTPVEVGGLYWHLVDLIWIYLFPLLYLVS